MKAELSIKEIQEECDGVLNKWLTEIKDKKGLEPAILVALFGIKECIVAHLSDIVNKKNYTP